MNGETELRILRRLLELANRNLRAGAVREIALQRQVREMRTRVAILETELYIAWSVNEKGAA